MPDGIIIISLFQQPTSRIRMAGGEIDPAQLPPLSSSRVKAEGGGGRDNNVDTYSSWQPFSAVALARKKLLVPISDGNRAYRTG